MWHQRFNRNFTKLREYFLCAKKKKRLYSTIRLLRVTLVPLWRVSTERKQPMLFCVSCVTWICCFRSEQSANNAENVSVWRSWHRIAYAVYVQWILSKMAPGWCGGDKLLNKVVIFIFYVHKKYSRSFVKVRLNLWFHMDCFNDVLATFLIRLRLSNLITFLSNALLLNFQQNIWVMQK